MSAAQLLGVAAATALVLAVAVWGRREGQEPGRHRAAQRSHLLRQQAAIAVLAEAFNTLTLTPETADEPLPYLPAEDYEYDIDDWTADLPTEAFPPLRIVHITDELIDEALAAADFSAERIHTSPSESAADDWPPIFAQLADQWGYDHERGFEGRAAA